MKVARAIMFIIVTLVLAGSLPAVGSAQDKKKDKKKSSGPVVLEEIVIEGRVQKPQAFYILQRSSFGYKIMEMEEDYTDEIIESVKDEVF
ncbi:MAG: hypothetical protein ABIJ56_18550 [Pseudomonadota bacterium]